MSLPAGRTYDYSALKESQRPGRSPPWTPRISEVSRAARSGSGRPPADDATTVTGNVEHLSSGFGHPLADDANTVTGHIEHLSSGSADDAVMVTGNVEHLSSGTGRPPVGSADDATTDPLIEAPDPEGGAAIVCPRCSATVLGLNEQCFQCDLKRRPSLVTPATARRKQAWRRPRGRIGARSWSR